MRLIELIMSLPFIVAGVTYEVAVTGFKAGRIYWRMITE